MDMDIISWHNILKEVENLQMFSLCKDFDNLSLVDGRSSSSSSSTSSSSSSSTSLVSSSSYSTSFMLPSSESYYTILGIVQPSSSSSSTSSSSSYSTSLVQPSSESSSTSSSSSSSTSLVLPSSYGYPGNFHRFLHSSQHWSLSISEQLRAPFIELPRNLLDSSSFKSYDISILLGFRFHPGQSEFLLQQLMLPESFERLSFLNNSLGLSYNRRPLSLNSLSPLSYSGAGLRDLFTDGYTKTLVEVITQYNGRWGRFLVLVCLGIGCTVWYGFAPGTDLEPAVGGVFTPLESYNQFFEMEYYAPGFHRVGFVERNDVSAMVVSALENELPFAEITIPASGHVLKAVGLGLMVAIFLTIGLVPNVSGSINV